jgi:RHS repeat-associated protein
MVQWGNTRYGFYPFGEPKGTAGYTGGTEYATYRKDETGLHYAVNRYYESSLGRFVTPDPYMASGGVGEPGSWNRYAYVEGDPVNFYDPSGLDACAVQYGMPCFAVTGTGRLPGGFGGGGGGGGGPEHAQLMAPPDFQIDHSGGGSYVQNSPIVVDGMEFINPSNDDPHQQVINTLLDQIRDTIDQDCSNWLLGNSSYANIGAYLDTLTNNTLIGHAVINDIQNPGTVTNAVTGSGAGGFAIVVNRNGAVFNASAPRSAGSQFNAQIAAINPRSQRQGVFILIHEFAHSLGASGFRPDRGNPNNGRLNNDDVWRNCNRMIGRARN